MLYGRHSADFSTSYQANFSSSRSFETFRFLSLSPPSMQLIAFHRGACCRRNRGFISLMRSERGDEDEPVASRFHLRSNTKLQTGTFVNSSRVAPKFVKLS
jgi:hypothetical protein